LQDKKDVTAALPLASLAKPSFHEIPYKMTIFRVKSQVLNSLHYSILSI